MAWFPCCCECNACTYCEDECAPNEWLVEITSFSDSASCTNCDEDANGSFVLPPTSTCGWTYGALGGPFVSCDFGPGNAGPRITALISQNFGGQYLITITVVVTHVSTSTTVTFQKNYGTTKPDCLNFADESIPHVSTVNASGIVCSVNTDPCLITSI